MWTCPQHVWNVVTSFTLDYCPFWHFHNNLLSILWVNYMLATPMKMLHSLPKRLIAHTLNILPIILQGPQTSCSPFMGHSHEVNNSWGRLPMLACAHKYYLCLFPHLPFKIKTKQKLVVSSSWTECLFAFTAANRLTAHINIYWMKMAICKE